MRFPNYAANLAHRKAGAISERASVLQQSGNRGLALPLAAVLSCVPKLTEPPMSDDLPVVMNTETHRFEVRLGNETAFAEYRLEPDSIVFPHTVVPEAFGGKGVGGKLVLAGLAYARDNKLWVKPTCPFFHAYIAKRPELHELVHPDMRAKLLVP
jgi:predicted GNAT family acetyltransferase